MARARSTEALFQLFKSENVVDLARIEKVLGGVSAMTAFRYLKQMPYRRSYNYNGRYYCLHEPSRYDRCGLWSWGDIHFSVEGSLRKTVRRLVYEFDRGATQRELQAHLRVRVHDTLLALIHDGEVERERLAQVYVYLHIDPAIRHAQLQRRQAVIAAQKMATVKGEVEVSDQVVIHVLLTLLHHRAAKSVDVVRYLRGHSPPITMGQVCVVFDRYDLDNIDKKGGATNF